MSLWYAACEQERHNTRKWHIATETCLALGVMDLGLPLLDLVQAACRTTEKAARGMKHENYTGTFEVAALFDAVLATCFK
eukprot:2197013-Amphidinium_carterae.1